MQGAPCHEPHPNRHRYSLHIALLRSRSLRCLVTSLYRAKRMQNPSRPLLDAEALAVFAQKGKESGPGIPQVGHGNAVKVRRVLQLVQDLSGRPLDELRILDLACGEGVYAIESALQGAEVVAIDARDERMREGVAVAARHGLSRLHFELGDIRTVTRETHGHFDVVLLLGIIYHLEAIDTLRVLENVRAMCRGLVVIDTLVSQGGRDRAEPNGRSYLGQRTREHGDEDAEAVRRARLQMSLDNTLSFRFTVESMVKALVDTGYSSVLQGHAPLESGKAPDRVTLVAATGEAVRVHTYPWINGLTEQGIVAKLDELEPPSTVPMKPGPKTRAKAALNRLLRPTGFEVRRI